MTGVVTAIVALAAATAVGLIWRQRSGVLRPQRSGMAGATSTADTAETPGTVQMFEAAETAQTAAAGDRLSAADLGPALGERATLVQFSSAFCAPCRATRRILDEVAEMVDGVRYVEIDAESRLDLVRRLGVLRTPTVLVLNGDGLIVRRGSGQPRKADVIAALGVAIPS
jgi:thiol-disulfide isomerase/thioredoxin